MRTSYPEARRKLLRLRRPTTRMAEFWLCEVRASLHVISAVSKIYPKSYKRKLKPLHNAFQDMRSRGFSPNQDEGSSNATEVMVRLISQHLFPLDDGWSYDMMSSFGDDLTLCIEVLGYKIDSETFDELLRDVVDDGEVRFSFPVMMGILWGFGDYSYEAEPLWEKCNEILGWGVPSLPEFHHKEDMVLDAKKLRRELKRVGLEPVYTLVEAVDGSTGNPFFDYDYECWQPPVLSAETLVHLHKEWKKARPLIDECIKAEKLLKKTPDAYKKLVEAYGRSLGPRKGN